MIDIGEQHHVVNVVHTNRALTDGNHAFALMTSKICSGKCGNDSMTRRLANLGHFVPHCPALPMSDQVRLDSNVGDYLNEIKDAKPVDSHMI